jgi:hypothetical protein
MLPEVQETIDAEIAVALGDAAHIDVIRMCELASLLEDAALPAWAERAMWCAEMACRTY